MLCPSAMHGVGWQWVERAFLAFGFSYTTLLPVSVQSQPDPNFPTVRFPNPEEKGALDESIKYANQLGSVSLIIANDPDADRLAAAEKCMYISVRGCMNMHIVYAVGPLEQ